MDNFLTKIHAKFGKLRPETVYSKNVENDLEWLSSLPQPKDYIDASYLQYLCQKKNLNSLLFFLLNFFSLFFYYLLLLPCYIKPEFEEQTDLSFYLKDEQYLPVTKKVRIINNYSKYYLSEKSKRNFVKDMERYSGAYLFKLKLLLKTGMYEYYIEKFHPHTIYCASEYSYCSSYLTLFCNRHGVSHCNVQHGEKVLNISNSFFTFDKMFVWDQEYINLFKQLRCNTKIFFVFTPTFFKNNCIVTTPLYDFKYYLQNQNGVELEKIGKMMEQLKKRGYNVAIRMHPAYSNKRFEKKYSNLIERNKDIAQSIRETKQAISQSSTVLLQSIYAGRGAIIDDVTSPQIYLNLSKLGYIMIKKNTPRLSVVLREIYK